MAKRGYKLQEFVAHSTNVNCLNIGKKACRMFITGGDDHKVNLWAIGKPTSLMSLCGHTSPVECVAFDTAEVLVLGGSSSGVIKLWDLEEAKIVRTLTGHRSNCTAVEFHPFGEFFASGSMDTNLRIWDIRKKGCIHTYKGHTRGISTIKFTPDGRWVVSGGFDNVVKVWDLTAGKLLHDFKFHEGHIRSIDFHPLEFLLATGSADRTVKFWDLETFELIGSARAEATGVRSITFHPDGRTLFCGLEDSLKVYSWEPVICHDAVDMGWSTLGDLCISEGKLLGCSYYHSSVGVWVADISLIEPYGAGFVPQETDCVDRKFDMPPSHNLDKVGSGVRSTFHLRSPSPDYETKEIKNIYVDSSGGNPIASQKVGSLSSPKVVFPSDPMEICTPEVDKHCPTIGVNEKPSGPALGKSFVVPRDSPAAKDSSGRETITFSKTKPGMLLRPAHVRKPSISKNDAERLSVALESGNMSTAGSEKESAMNCSLQRKIVSEDGAQKSSDEKSSNINAVADKHEKILSPEKLSNQENSNESVTESQGITSVKIVKGVAVMAGRTRSLVERFERRERFSNEGIQEATPENKASSIATKMTPHILLETHRTSPTVDRTPTVDVTPDDTSETDRKHTGANMASCIMPETDRRPSIATKTIPPITPETDMTPPIATTTASHIMPGSFKTSFITPRNIHETDRTPYIATTTAPRVTSETVRTPNIAATMTPSSVKLSLINRHNVPEADRTPSITITAASRVKPQPVRMPSTASVTPLTIHEMDRTPPMQKEEPQISGRELTSVNYGDVTEDLMQTHEVFLSTLKSRLTKLQVVRHFWERNDIKGAINALRKLPDHSVQADVLSVLMEKMEILTLDLFSGLLPVLVGLLDSKTERHANVSLEMLLKLVAVFGPVIRSAVSAPRAVGVDLHAEQRRECCNQCFIHLQKIQQILPELIRKGGLIAKCARELNLVLQES